MLPGLVPSDLPLALTMGAVLHIGIQNVWFWRRTRGGAVHGWTAAWCAASLAFQVARLVQLHTTSAATSVWCSRVEVAAVPLLVLSLLGFARELCPGREGRATALATAVAGLSAAALALGTDWFVGGETVTRTDWFGRTYLGAPTRATMLVYLPVIAAAFAYLVRQLRDTTRLDSTERRALWIGLGLYAVLGAFSILASARLVDLPIAAQYGPVVVAVALNHVLTNRHGRLQSELEMLVEERTAEIATINRSLERRLAELTAARDEVDRAHARLAESEARYRELVEHAPVGVVSCDREGRVDAVNPRAVELLGAPSADAALGVDVLEERPLLESGLPALVAACLATGQPHTAEISTVSPWGVRNEVRLHLAARRDAEGGVVGVLGTIENIGEERRLQRHLRQSQRIEAVGRLAAGIAHEINNPMAYVRTNLGMLRTEFEATRTHLEKRGDADALARLDECGALIDESLEGVDRTIDIVRDVRALAHGGGPSMEAADLNAVIGRSLRLAEGSRGPDVEVEWRPGPPLQVACSPGQLQQVVVNLLVNAFQAVGARGRVALTAAREADRAVVRVTDDGPGVPPDAVEHLYDPFFTTKPAGQGTGLGLYIAHEIVRLHGGDLRIASGPGPGATFEVWLPCE